jgi:sec-independent protein translocase protein TatA
MFGFSGEHLLVLLVILLIFGPKRLPDLGHSLGRTLKNFKDAMGGNHADPIPPAQQIPPAAAQPSATVTPQSTEKQTESADSIRPT